MHSALHAHAVHFIKRVPAPCIPITQALWRRFEGHDAGFGWAGCCTSIEQRPYTGPLMAGIAGQAHDPKGEQD